MMIPPWSIGIEEKLSERNQGSKWMHSSYPVQPLAQLTMLE